MAVHRLSWTTAAQGAQVVPAVLIAGLRDLIVPSGVAVTSVVWTDAADPAWHAGNSPTTKDWLDLGPDAPPLVIEENASPVQGTLAVKDVTLHLLDVAGAVVRCFESPATPFALLAADVTAAATDLPVDAIDLFASSGVVHLGRERIVYSGKMGASLTGCTRGTAGTKAQPYTAASRSRVYAEPAGVDLLLSTVGRRVTVWMLRLVAGVATDPTLVYDGRGTVGGGLVQGSDGVAWELATRHVLKELAQKSAPPRVTLYGYAHPDSTGLRSASTESESSSDMTPLTVWWMPSSGAGACVMLGNATPAPDSGGWHASRESFVADWNAAAAGLGVTIRAAVGGDGRCRVAAADGTGRRLTGKFGWTRALTAAYPAERGDTANQAQIEGAEPMPAACVWLQGAVTLAPSDVAQVPAVPSALSDSATAFWTLRAKRENGIHPTKDITARVTAVGATTVDVSGEPDFTALGPAGVLLTKPTTAVFGLEASGPRWWTVLRYAVFDQVDSVRGLDWLGDSIDWTRIATVATTNPGLGSPARELAVDLSAPLLDLLKTEARLLGGALVTHHGRVAFGVFRVLALTTPRVANVTTNDLRADAYPTMEKSPDGILTSMALTIGDTGDVIRTVDRGAVQESGEGEEVEVTVPRGCLPQGVETTRIFETVTALAMNTIAPFARPYHVVTLPVTLAFAGVEVADVVGVEAWMLPTAEGARGLDAQGTVIGRRLDFATGEVDLKVMTSALPVYGYAPSALVTSISGAVLTLNTLTFGAHGFADTYQDDGVTLRTDGGASTFTPGDKVQLVELDATSPATPFDGEVLSTSGATVTLTASPGATWEGRASAGLVMLVFDTWADVVTAQERWAFVADDSTVALSDGTPARRYA